MSSGDAPAVRTAALARLRSPGPDADEWRLLLAEVELRDGRNAAAVELLRGLVKRESPPQRRVRAAFLFARALVEYEHDSADRRLLESVLDKGQETEGRVERIEYGEAALVAAAIHRAVGEEARAAGLYAKAAAVLPDGPTRAEALYWIGRFTLEAAPRADAWERAAEVQDGGPWPALAQFEVGFDYLRRGYDERVR